MNAYTTAPTIIDRACVAAYSFPSARILSPSVASATDGAAPNNPAKLFGFNMSPNTANKETIVPPTRNRKMSCVMKLFSRHSELAEHDTNSFLFTLNSAGITAA